MIISTSKLNWFIRYRRYIHRKFHKIKYSSQISNELTNCLFATSVSSQQNEKHPNEGQQRLPQTLGYG